MKKIYLEDIPLEQAQERFQSALEECGLWQTLGVERIPLDENAIGRVLAETVWAKISSPHYHASAMDGFAVRAEETHGALETSPISLSYNNETVYLDTGDPLPDWANAVIPIENIEPLSAEGTIADDPRQPYVIRIRAAVSPWSHVREMGEDMVATQLVLPYGHKLRPFDLGAAAGCGYDQLDVARRPKVAVIPTGTELVYPGDPLKDGDIIEYNSIVLAAQVNEWGGEGTRFENIPDDFGMIKTRVIQAAADSDLILLVAGSSAGSEDYSSRIVEETGQLLVHGIAVRPGHPVILGIVKSEGKTTPIIGVPGYPVSAALTAEIFVEPLLGKWLGRPPIQPQTIQAEISRKVNSRGGDDEYLRVAVGYIGSQAIAAPLSRGSGVITSLVRADGIVIIPRGIQGLQAREQVSVQLYRSVEELKNTIFAIGSHDLTLDLISQFLSPSQRRLASVNVGSLGGIMALKRGETHLAGSHLLHPESGEYNLPYIREHLPGLAVRVVTLVGRTQGLFLLKGNPKGILGLDDLIRDDISFVNRQRGSGTRLLLDYHLGDLGIQVDNVSGYKHEEFTHLSAAAVVASGRADCALGIEAASYALDLDFLPLFTERYDLLIPEEFVTGELLKPLFELLDNPQFKKAVAERPGYDISRMGEVVAVLNESV
ncbi:MAG: molybdopterin biosynthesis protein [Anaerolineales bacterium]|nr:molybdopterin biosynthesis protein [Anaerolineales bacterium]